MIRAIQKILLLLLGTFLLLWNDLNIDRIVVIMIIIISLSALALYMENSLQYKIFYLVVFLIVCLIDNNFIYLAPLVIYDTMDKRYSHINIVIIFVIILVSNVLIINKALIVIVAVFSIIGSYLLNEYITTKKELYDTKNNLNLLELEIQSQRQQLIDAQDNEVQNAMLNERGRIAREIHDNVGHILSSSIIQLGAIKKVNKNDALQPLLETLDESLNQGMDSIRNSVHNMHAQSFDLKMELEKVVDNYLFCPVKLSYSISNKADKKVKSTILAIIKEALNNTLKHSDASLITISIREIEQYYQIIINDNGTHKTIGKKGIGLLSMEERVEMLGGIFNYTFNEGFKIHFTIPKKEKEH